MRYLRITGLLLAAALLVPLAAPLAAAERDTAGIADQAVRSVSWVITDKDSGTGFVIDVQQRWLITNYRVVKESENVHLVFPQSRNGQLIRDRDHYWNQWKQYAIRGRVIARDATQDLALIEAEYLPRGTRAIPFAQDAPQPGMRLHRMGSPAARGEVWKLTTAELKKMQVRSLKYPSGQVVKALCLLNDGDNRPGDSGRPVLNDQGELVGVHCAFLDGEQLSAAVGLGELKRFLEPQQKRPPTTQPKIDGLKETPREHRSAA